MEARGETKSEESITFLSNTHFSPGWTTSLEVTDSGKDNDYPSWPGWWAQQQWAWKWVARSSRGHIPIGYPELSFIFHLHTHTPSKALRALGQERLPTLLRTVSKMCPLKCLWHKLPIIRIQEEFERHAVNLKALSRLRTWIHLPDRPDFIGIIFVRAEIWRFYCGFRWRGREHHGLESSEVKESIIFNILKWNKKKKKKKPTPHHPFPPWNHPSLTSILICHFLSGRAC